MVEMDGIGSGNVRTPLTSLRVDPVPTPDLVVALGALLDRAIEAQRADFGAIRLYQPSRNTLRLAVHRNFDPAMIESVMEMPVDSGAMRAFTHGRVIIEDLYGHEDFERLRPLSEKLGVRAVQFSLIVTRSGDRLGLLATHFKRPHSPSPFALTETDRIVATAAEVIELWGHADHSPARAPQEAKLDLRETFILALKAAPPRPGSFALPQDIARLLERSTESYATRRRAEKATPEEMVVELKQMLREIDDAIAVEFRRDLSSDAIRWAIQAYYRPASQPE